MHQAWEQFLRAKGALIESGRVLHFGNPPGEVQAARDSNTIADLSHWSLIRADGKDAETFLQGQFSNDLRLIGTTSQLHAYCNAQGRMLAILRIFRRDDALFLQLPASLAEATLKRLRMFVLRAQVKLELVDDSLLRIGLSGPELVKELSRVSLPLPEENGCITQDGITILRLPGPHARTELIGPAEAIQRIWETVNATAVGAGAWGWLDIVAGLPVVLPETVEQFVPQMANLDLVGGINFKKGCYPGQEIVARMHYLGRLKQRMYLAHLSGEACPRPGEPLFAPDFGDQAAGMVVDAQRAPAGGCDLLAVLQMSSASLGDVQLARPAGAPLTLKQLPYSFPAAS